MTTEIFHGPGSILNRPKGPPDYWELGRRIADLENVMQGRLNARPSLPLPEAIRKVEDLTKELRRCSETLQMLARRR